MERGPSPTPYSALSRGSKIPNLNAAAQATASTKTLTTSALDFPGQYPDFPLTNTRGKILFLSSKTPKSYLLISILPNCSDP